MSKILKIEMIDILKESRAIQSELVEYYRFLHQNPEIGFNLPVTIEFIISKLKSFGYKNIEQVGGGVVALLKGKSEGKTVLLRADMDALPFEEKTTLEFKATNGNMHACGHDFNSAILLGAAKILMKHKDTLNGNVKFMFQPDEEGLSGAKTMIEEGVLESPKVDHAMAIHLLPHLGENNGKIVLKTKDVLLMGSDEFQINIFGKGEHAGVAHLAIDANYIMSNIMLNLQSINSRETSGNSNVILTIGSLSGGNSFKHIAGEATMKGYLKTTCPDLRLKIIDRIKQIANMTAQMYKGRVEIEFFRSVPPFVVGRETASKTEKIYKDLFVDDLLNFDDVLDNPLPASDDFSYVACKVPSIHVFLSSMKKVDGNYFHLHHPKVVFDEDNLHKGVVVYIGFVKAILCSKDEVGK